MTLASGLVLVPAWACTVGSIALAQSPTTATSAKVSVSTAASASAPTVTDYLRELSAQRLIAKETGTLRQFRDGVRTASDLVMHDRADQAVVVLYELLESPRFEDFRDTDDAHQAEYLIGVALRRTRAYETARAYLERLIRDGRDSSYWEPAVRAWVDVALELGAPAEVLRESGMLFKGVLPADSNAELQYLRARALYDARDWRGAEVVFDRVPARSRWYVNAQYYLGVLATKQKNYDKAVKHFCVIARTRDQSAQSFVIDSRYFELKDLSRLALGRIAHETGNAKHAFYYYFQVPQDSERLPEALFEAAWAMYEGKDAETALDLIDQLQTKFKYSPYASEAVLLRGYIDLERCEFEKARQLFDEYLKRHRPLLQVVRSWLADPLRRETLYERLLQAESSSQSGSSSAPARRVDPREPISQESLLLTWLRVDPEFYEWHQRVRTLDAEAARAGRVSRDWSALEKQLGGVGAARPIAAENVEQEESRALQEMSEGVVAIRRSMVELSQRLGDSPLPDAPTLQVELSALHRRATSFDKRIARYATALEAERAQSGDRSGPTAGTTAVVDTAGAPQGASGSRFHRVIEWMRRDQADGARQQQHAMRVRGAMVRAASAAAFRSMQTLEQRIATDLRKARIGQIDAVMGSKRRIQAQIEQLAQGKLPLEFENVQKAQGLLADDEEYWPYDGEDWPDEFVERPADHEEDETLRRRIKQLSPEEQARRAQMIAELLQSREHLLTVRREQAIGLLQAFVREEPEQAPEMADALLRLAELRWEDARARYLAAFGAWQQTPAQRRSAEAPKPDYRGALALYDRILQRHHAFERTDLVLYMKAYALVEMDQPDEALALYRRILQDYPRSKFVPDAHMAVAEAAFSGRYDYAAALAEYEQVLKFPHSDLYDMALFKSAWCLWRLGQSKEAARRFRQVLDLGDTAASKQYSATRRKRIEELQNEALEYLIQVFTEDESNSAADIRGFLAEIGGERYARRVLARLSETFYEQARYDRGTQGYQLLLELEPDSKDAPRFQKQIAYGFEQMGDDRRMVEALGKLAAMTATTSASALQSATAVERDGRATRQVPNQVPNQATNRAAPSWAERQGDAQVVRDAQRMSEQTIREYALRAHQLAQRDHSRPQYELAVRLYTLYLNYYSRAKGADEIQFYVGEVQYYRLGNFIAAGDAYMASVELNPKGRYAKSALGNAIASYEKAQDKNNKGTQDQSRLASALEKYVVLFPNDPELPAILFRQGKLYYDRGQYDPAVRLFGQLLERYPNHPAAAQAGELILQSFHRANDYQNIEVWARRLKKAPAFRAVERQRKLDALIVQATFKVGEQLAAKGEHAKAADAYHRAATEFPAEARAKQAYFNAGLERQRAGDLQGARKEYDEVIRRYPGSAEGAKAAWQSAQMFESVALFSEAALYYSTYGRKFSGDEKPQDALYNAIVLSHAARNDSGAVQAAQEFLSRFPKDPLATDVYFLKGKAEESSKQYGQAVATYQAFIRRAKNLDRKFEAYARLARVQRAAGKRADADKTLLLVQKLSKRNLGKLKGEGRYFVAQARVMQGDIVVEQFDAIVIAGADLAQRLRRKSELLKQSALIYADVAKLRVAEWTTASLYKIGRGYEEFAEALREAPVPKGLSADEEQSYKDQLSMFIVPMEDKALQAYEGGYRKAIELSIYNEWTARLREGLTRLNDVEHPAMREMGAQIVSPSIVPQVSYRSTLDQGAPLQAGSPASRGAGKSKSTSSPTSSKNGGGR